MNKLIYIASQVSTLLLLLFVCIFIVYSFIEKEKKAVQKSVPVLLLLLFLEYLLFYEFAGTYFQIVYVLIFTGLSILILLPFQNKKVIYQQDKSKYDERDIMFSRMELEEGTKKFNAYYNTRKEKKEKDDRFRKEPGLLSPQAKFYDTLQFNAAAATFSTVDLLHPLVEKEIPQQPQKEISPQNITVFIKNWGLKLGAVDLGITILKPEHIYSHIGRGKSYGEVVDLQHKYAIAFTVEMSHESLRYTPKGPIIMESAQQYLNAGAIAVQITEFIRNMGYEARAHIDANYRLICPLVAQDAGLGTIGRMGLLMTPKHGPRVRIGVVTTNMEMEFNSNPIDSSMLHFCEICKKCATNCPSSAISTDSAKKNGKWYPWKIDHEKCFTYWCKAGTDCGRCVTVCPYSHPNNIAHSIVRWSLKRNSVNRWFASVLDDFIYGKKPGIIPLQKWMKYKQM